MPVKLVLFALIVFLYYTLVNCFPQIGVNRLKKINSMKKPPCGPVRFPDFSCEEATTCIPVPRNKKSGLHGKFVTICVLVSPTAAELRKRREDQITDGMMHTKTSATKVGAIYVNYNGYLRQVVTTSTFPPFDDVNGTTTSPAPSTMDIQRCQGLAVCKKHDF